MLTSFPAIRAFLSHAGFLLAAAEQFREPPPAVAARSAAAWRLLSAVDAPLLPCINGEGLETAKDPLQHLQRLAAERGAAPAAAAAAEPMAVDGQEGSEAGHAAPAGSEQEQAQLAAVHRSLYYLLSVLQGLEVRGGADIPPSTRMPPAACSLLPLPPSLPNLPQPRRTAPRCRTPARAACWAPGPRRRWRAGCRPPSGTSLSTPAAPRAGSAWPWSTTWPPMTCWCDMRPFCVEISSVCRAVVYRAVAWLA